MCTSVVLCFPPRSTNTIVWFGKPFFLLLFFNGRNDRIKKNRHHIIPICRPPPFPFPPPAASQATGTGGGSGTTDETHKKERRKKKGSVTLNLIRSIFSHVPHPRRCPRRVWLNRMGDRGNKRRQLPSLSLSFPPATARTPDNLQGFAVSARCFRCRRSRARTPSVLVPLLPTTIKRVWVSSVLATSHPITRSPLSLIVCRSLGALVKKIKSGFQNTYHMVIIINSCGGSIPAARLPS